MYSSGLYAELRERTGLDPGWRGVGGLRLATTPERVEELRRQVSAATTYGLELDLLTAGRGRRTGCRCSTSTTCSPPAGCPATATWNRRSWPGARRRAPRARRPARHRRPR